VSSTEAKNLEVISRAIDQHNATCARVSLNALSSSDPDGNLRGFFWTVNNNDRGSGTVADVILGLGANTVTLLAVDTVAAVGSAETTIMVVDTTAPDIVITEPTPTDTSTVLPSYSIAAWMMDAPA